MTLHTKKLASPFDSLSVGDTWRLELPAHDEWAQDHKSVGLRFNGVIVELFKDGTFKVLSVTEKNKIEYMILDDTYLNKLLHRSELV